MTIIRDGNGDVINSDNPLPITIVRSDAIIPTDVQTHAQQTIQTHNAVIVPLSGSSDSAWIDCDGFDKIGITIKNDASTSNSADIHWSHDGSTQFAYDNVISTNTLSQRAGITDVKARYARLHLTNGDTVDHTMSAYVYLKP